ncbi:MAG TPA: circularly permuted type 2 ATP-grasp protein, partial [Polyangiaceae bacterium]|nr:circularly permuted type 2 ATP-grasp protein [Polyangiaceae bacterium]
MRLTPYYDKGFFDEVFAAGGTVRPAYAELVRRLGELSDSEFERRRRLTDLLLRNQGVTFTVYSDDQGIEKVFPFDPIPRLIASDEWERVERGLVQRIEALNLFLQDVYHDQKILRDGVIEPELVYGATFFRREMMGFDPPRGVYTHVVGTDLIRDEHGQLLVLEDNARNPSGVSYLLGCRPVMKRVFPALFEDYGVRSVDDYPSLLRETLSHAAPAGSASPTIALLTPGVHNSAYFEHSYLSREMGIPLVEGRDLVIKDGAVCMRTTQGLTRVDVI